MNRVRRAMHFCWDFVVGDDWRVAVGVVAGLAVTGLAAHHGRNWFWIAPVSVLAILSLSLLRATRRGQPHLDDDGGPNPSGANAEP